MDRLAAAQAAKTQELTTAIPKLLAPLQEVATAALTTRRKARESLRLAKADDDAGGEIVAYRDELREVSDRVEQVGRQINANREAYAIAQVRQDEAERRKNGKRQRPPAL